MAQSVEFEVSCPNNHDQTRSFTRDSLEAALKTGKPVFHCNTCDTDWYPGSEQLALMRKALPETTEHR